MRRLLPALLLAAGIGAAAPAEAAAPACPSTDIDAFLKAFIDDVAVQRAFTAQPLHDQYVDATADPEPRPVTQMLSEPALTFPVIPTRNERATLGLEQTWLERGDQRAVLRLAKPDTDLQLTYVFRKQGCWQLVERQDDSL
ncbi:hypothetical protein [Inquilinus limosus]|uniref:DUF3828 domain-containing protein n=1 Tax=Inquilinus limosus TaxID=171674 RepID=A0A211ZPE4_9PROT|nr:hypothetical protein [Inquilinus limosus]OWJ67158.1 hypothetical protein BWR60_11535 [Inquilinus limosus]